MKLNKLFRTVITMIAVFFMALSSNATPIKAGTILNTEKTEYTYRSISGITGEVKEQNIFKMNMQGVYAFCVESGIPTSFGTEYTEEEFISPHKDMLSKIAYYGYTKTSRTDYDYAVTQLMIWEHLGDTLHYTNIPDYEQRKQEILSMVNAHDSIPSWNDITVEIDEGNTQIIVDENNILDKMSITSNTTNSDISIVGKELHITTTSQSESGTITFAKFDENEIGTSIIYKKPETQSLVEFHLESNVTATVNIKINYYNDFSIHKLNETYTIENDSFQYEMTEPATNVIFTLENNDGYVIRNVESDETGILSFNDIPLGTFYLKEIQTSTDDYILTGEVLRVESTRGQIKIFNDKTNIEFDSSSDNKFVFEYYNYLKKGTIEVTKQDIDTEELLSNATINIYDSEMNLVTSKVTDEEGRVILENVPKGIYYIQEAIAPAGYYLEETLIKVEILEDGDVVYQTITNKKIEELPKTGIKTIPVTFTGSVLILLFIARKVVLKIN